MDVNVCELLREKSSKPAMDQIFGYIERITFHNEENGFTVARLKLPKKKDLVTAVGILPGIQPGESVRLLGHWKNNATHGMQFEVKECHIERPCDRAGIQKYLESGMVRGIGRTYAERIVKAFGEKTLEIDSYIELVGFAEENSFGDILSCCRKNDQALARFS